MYRSNSQRKRKKSQTTTKQTLTNANILNCRHSDKQQTKEPGDILYLYQLEKKHTQNKNQISRMASELYTHLHIFVIYFVT